MLRSMLAMILLDGQEVSKLMERRILEVSHKLERIPKLAIIQVGDNAASTTYVNMKRKKCLELGFGCQVISFDRTASQSKVCAAIHELNSDENVNGILVQLPLPSHLSTRTLLDTVAIPKDVDGLHSYHLMRILLNEEEILPATPKGILELLAAYNIPLQGKAVCVVGFSDVVGKPLATACLNRGATVTICNRSTQDLAAHTKAADILMSATGVPNIITADMVKPGAVVVDIGINKVNGMIVGDVDFESVKAQCSYITPVPGGVGPMTITSLVDNLVLLTKRSTSS